MSDIREICSSSKIAIHDVPAREVDIESVSEIKREAITELLALHDKDREKVSSQCNTLINMSTVDKYLRSLG